MGWFSSTKTVDTNSDGVISATEIEKLILSMMGTKYMIDCSTVTGRQDAYKKCDIVRSVLGKSSSAIANLRIKVTDKQGNTVDKPEAVKIMAKINKPNGKEDFKRFFRKLDLYCKLHGKAFVRIVDNGKLGIDYYVVPNEFVHIFYTNKTDLYFERKVDRYEIRTGVDVVILGADEMHVFYDGTLSATGYEIFGASRLESLSEPVSAYATIFQVLTELFGSGGAENIIAMGAKDHTMLTSSASKDEKEDILAKLRVKYGKRRGQNRNLVLSGEAKVHPLTAKIVDMDIPNAIKQAIKAVYSAYEWPAELASIDTSRYKTMPEARKEAYTQSAVPSLEYYFSEWLNMVGMPNADFVLRADYSHLDFYQESKKEKAVAFSQLAQVMPKLIEAGVYEPSEVKAKLEAQ